MEDVEVGDINAFQGRQHEVIVLCLVRSNPEHRFGYADDVRRANEQDVELVALVALPDDLLARFHLHTKGRAAHAAAAQP